MREEILFADLKKTRYGPGGAFFLSISFIQLERSLVSWTLHAKGLLGHIVMRSS